MFCYIALVYVDRFLHFSDLNASNLLYNSKIIGLCRPQAFFMMNAIGVHFREHDPGGLFIMSRWVRIVVIERSDRLVEVFIEYINVMRFGYDHGRVSEETRNFIDVCGFCLE